MNITRKRARGIATGQKRRPRASGVSSEAGIGSGSRAGVIFWSVGGVSAGASPSPFPSGGSAGVSASPSAGGPPSPAP